MESSPASKCCVNWNFYYSFSQSALKEHLLSRTVDTKVHRYWGRNTAKLFKGMDIMSLVDPGWGSSFAVYKL